LEDLGYTVIVAKDGQEAIDLFNANRGRIALLLLDVVMPRLSGSDAYEQIHRIDDRLPVIFMTGYSEETVQSKFVRQNKLIEEQGIPVIQKPYDLDMLGRTIRAVLDGSWRTPDRTLPISSESSAS
jgi:CheY-like chemotaxis protein